MATGKGLGFIINCNLTPQHDWMAFASWYSISKNFPDAKIIVTAQRDIPSAEFSWCRKCQVPLIQYKEVLPELDVEKTIVISPSVMAVRSNDDLRIVSSKSSEQSSLVDYLDGCGRFVTNEWIHKKGSPFSRASAKFTAGDLTVNEIAILKLWERCAIYDQL